MYFNIEIVNYISLGGSIVEANLRNTLNNHRIYGAIYDNFDYFIKSFWEGSTKIDRKQRCNRNCVKAFIELFPLLKIE